MFLMEDCLVMSELWLVRHGQTDWNVQGIYQGQSDVPLNETGRTQARELALKLQGQHFEAIYSSDLSRARETAEILAKHLDLSLKIDRRLREICHGEWEGMHVQDIAVRYNLDMNTPHKRPVDSRAPGGESVIEVKERMIAAANDLTSAYPMGQILVVSHGLAVAALYCEASGLPLAEAYRHIPQNGQPVVVPWERRHKHERHGETSSLQNI
jgi:broad specificity phosphatase PhoE